MNQPTKKVILAVIGIVALMAMIILVNNNTLTLDTSLPSFLKDTGDVNSEQPVSSYTHPDNSFSFSYPGGFSVRTQDDEEGGETITIEREGMGIQIFISPFDESITLTPERIREDIPDMRMFDAQIIQVDGAPAVAFTSTDASFGASAEVWLVRAGKLYQVSTPDNSRAILYNILTSWRWSKLK